MSLARRSVASTLWNAASNFINLAVLFARSVLLARLLPVEVFGIYGLASSVVGLTIPITDFGMFGAFLHRTRETADEEQVTGAYFSLKLVFVLAWCFLLLLGAATFANGPTRTALALLTVSTGLLHLAQIPKLILIRRVEHGRLALLQLVNALLTTTVALGLATRGVTLWALLATDLVTLFTTMVLLHLWRPIWRPRLHWSPPIVRYLLGFGSRNFLAGVLLQALNRFDDLWTGLFLGETPLGFYTRAYAFATYPARIVAAPIRLVVSGAYAELKGNRAQLSQAFFRTNSLMIRSGFLLGGLLALTAPAFIRLLLGARWLPMLDTLRLMLVFTLLDPIKMTVSDLFVAVGRPEQIVHARIVQLVVLAAGLFLLGARWGIAGVALAVDSMLAVGIAVLLWRARSYVDFSPWRMFATPSLALLCGLILARAAVGPRTANAWDWQTALGQAAAFTAVYSATVVGLERTELSKMLSFMTSRMFAKGGR